MMGRARQLRHSSHAGGTTGRPRRGAGRGEEGAGQSERQHGVRQSGQSATRRIQWVRHSVWKWWLHCRAVRVSPFRKSSRQMAQCCCSIESNLTFGSAWISASESWPHGSIVLISCISLRNMEKTLPSISADSAWFRRARVDGLDGFAVSTEDAALHIRVPSETVTSRGALTGREAATSSTTSSSSRSRFVLAAPDRSSWCSCTTVSHDIPTLLSASARNASTLMCPILFEPGLSVSDPTVGRVPSSPMLELSSGPSSAHGNGVAGADPPLFL
mmetsp:Transcript_7449/g.20962  ORF Transcript_7449/g.20962 Transcript_7449/m.20962 type:complete len:273 (+) Transcript_7449:44-862(+)